LASSGGPSAEQSFTVSGSDLNADIVLTAPTHYEISIASGTGFTSVVTLTKDGSNAVASTIIYVRLKASLPASAYNSENITIATNGMTTQNVACSGSASVPTITMGRNVITNTYLTYTLGGGPSTGRDCTVSGVNLLEDIIVTCPANFEIASDASYVTATTTTLTFPAVNGSASGTVYTRLKSGLLTDLYTGNVAFASNSAVFSGASTDNLLNLAGSVTGGSVIFGATAILPVVSSLSTFTYAGNGPSASSNNLKITCSGLSSAVTVTPSAGFEVSTDDITFVSTPMDVANDGSGNIVAGTIIYTRMAAGLTLGSKTGTITLSATGATTRTVSVSGTVTSSITTVGLLVGFKAEGNGPSVEKSFTVKGTNTTSAITVTPPTHYEISATSGSGFGLTPLVLASVVGDSVPTTPIYVRLKGGFAIGTYNADTILITNANATTKKLACTGTVYGIVTSLSAIADMNYIPNGGPSAERMFTVAADSLQSDLLITPPANFEISLTSGSNYQTTPITLTQTLGVVATTNLYVRLVIGLSDSNYSGNIDFTATGVTAVAIALSGRVDISVPINEALSNRLMVIPQAGSLKVSGAHSGDLIEVYNAYGQTLKTVRATDGDNYIATAARGVLFVKVGTSTKKVVLR
jgi:hypothetical protein